RVDMKFKRIASLEVTLGVQNRRDGVNIITAQRIGEIGQLPTGELVLKLYGNVNFEALPRDEFGRIAANFRPSGNITAKTEPDFLLIPTDNRTTKRRS
ncbi:MAG: hypothetical protein IJQ63_00370, partial [Synergistaceae bacterium]|nr:hypothetical protein [Synergistaceae bacterium]